MDNSPLFYVNYVVSETSPIYMLGGILSFYSDLDLDLITAIYHLVWVPGQNSNSFLQLITRVLTTAGSVYRNFFFISSYHWDDKKPMNLQLPKFSSVLPNLNSLIQGARHEFCFPRHSAFVYDILICESRDDKLKSLLESFSSKQFSYLQAYSVVMFIIHLQKYTNYGKNFE